LIHHGERLDVDVI
jgi:hypothetical protein